MKGEPAIKLAYEMVCDQAFAEEISGSRVKVGRVVGNKRITKPNWLIQAAAGGETYIPAVDKNGDLRVDYLLLSRIRNFLDPDAFRRGRFIVSWAGCHGAATMAAGLFLRRDKVRRDLWRKIRAFPEFQVLVRVPKISLSSWGFEPADVEIVDFCPLDIHAKDYEIAMDRLEARRERAKLPFGPQE